MDDDFLRDLFGSVGPIAVRRMFGGKGIFADGMMIALLAFDDVFVKADTETEDLFRSAGSRPFQYRARCPCREGSGFLEPARGRVGRSRARGGLGEARL